MKKIPQFLCLNLISVQFFAELWSPWRYFTAPVWVEPVCSRPHICPTQELKPIRVEKEESACGAQLRICIHLHIQEQILEFCHQQQCLFNRFIKIKVTMCLQPKKKTLRRSDMFKHYSEKIFIYMLILVKDASLQNKVPKSLWGCTNTLLLLDSFILFGWSFNGIHLERCFCITAQSVSVQ